MHLIAHRGVSAHAPDNSIEAFSLAVAHGADGVELDTRLTADDVVVVSHDPALADGRVIAETRAEDLPPGVARLGPALDACGHLFVNVELKELPGEPGHGRVEDLVGLVLAELDGRSNEFVLSSFDLDLVDTLPARTDLPTAYIWWGQPAEAEIIGRATEFGHEGVHPRDQLVDEAMVARARAAGLAVRPWTVDDGERLRQLARIGVDAVVTNDPAAARRAVEASPA